MSFSLPPSKRIILHIGPPKTGSSAIQKFLLDNVSLLKQKGIYYPQHSVDKNGISSGNQDAILEHNNKGELTINRSKIAALLNAFQTSSANVLLLSSEAFFKRANTLIRILPNCEAIAFVRSPLDFVESIYNQSVKRHFVTSKIRLPKTLGTYHLDKLAELIERNQEKKVRLLAYSQNNGVDAVGRFVQSLDKSIAVPAAKQRINTSYCHEALQFKRLINRFRLTSLDFDIDRALQAYNPNTRNYTYIPRQTYKQYANEALQALDSFCNTYAVSGGQALVDELKTLTPFAFKEQCLSGEELASIIEFFKRHSLKTFLELRSALMKQGASSSDAKLIWQAVVYQNRKSRLSLYCRVMFTREIKWCQKIKYLKTVRIYRKRA